MCVQRLDFIVVLDQNGIHERLFTARLEKCGDPATRAVDRTRGRRLTKRGGASGYVCMCIHAANELGRLLLPRKPCTMCTPLDSRVRNWKMRIQVGLVSYCVERSDDRIKSTVQR